MSATKRIKTAVVRSEGQPYNFAPAMPRGPRISGASGHLWCQFSGTLNGATGSWPSLTPGSLSSQTVYTSNNGALTAQPGTRKVWNWYSTSFTTGKTTLLLPNGDGSCDVAEQDC